MRIRFDSYSFKIVILICLTMIFFVLSLLEGYVGSFLGFLISLIILIIVVKRRNKARTKPILDSTNIHDQHFEPKPTEIIKSRSSMTGGKKTLLVIGIIIIGFFVFSALAYYTTSDETRAMLQKERLAKEQQDAEEERQDNGSNLKNVLDVIPSKLSNISYYNNAEKILSKFVLNYKGSDNSGWTVSEMLLVEFAAECGTQLYLDQYGFKVESWISDYTEKQVDMRVLTSNDKGDLCALTNFEIYVDPRTGRILGGDEAGKNVLNLLDNVHERIIIGKGDKPLSIPENISIDDLKALVQDLSN